MDDNGEMRLVLIDEKRDLTVNTDQYSTWAKDGNAANSTEKQSQEHDLQFLTPSGYLFVVCSVRGWAKGGYILVGCIGVLTLIANESLTV